jgi:hypothetical protein
MMSRNLSEEIIRNTPWGDVELCGVFWTEDGRDVILHVRLPGRETPVRNRSLACRWAHGLLVQLAFPEGRGGFPLTWDATFTWRADGTLAVRLDFADSGELRLICNELEFVESPLVEQ